MSRWKNAKKWGIRVLIALVVVYLIFIGVVIPYWATNLITHAKTRSFELKVQDTPEKFNVAFEDITIPAIADPSQAEKQVPSLSAWYLPNDTAKAVIIYTHGFWRSRQEVLERACEMTKKGYAGLIIETRRHGRSTGHLTSIGYLERLDVRGAIHHIKSVMKLKIPVVTYGVSAGAAATLLAAAEDSAADLIIVDSSFLSFESMIKHHAGRFFPFWLPTFPIANLVIYGVQSKIGFSDADFDLRLAAQKIGNRPILFIAGEADTRMPVAYAKKLLDASPSEAKELSIIPDATHGAGFRIKPRLYIETMDSFIQKCLPDANSSAPKAD